MKHGRTLYVNWKAIDGASHGKRKLAIRRNNNGGYTCPVTLCLHDSFKSNRGLRKHINTKHHWYYYFDEQPELKREEIEVNQPAKLKASTSKKPAFSLEEGIGFEFLKWLCTSCGGGKSEKEAKQTGKRAMKFFMEALGENENDNRLTYEYVDCCLSSASVIIKFLQTLEDTWKALNYVKAIGDMVDFRKANGVSDNTLRCFTVTEVYLRRAKENLRKKKNFECNRNLDLETLIARDSWATIEEMEEVIPFHIKSFKTVIQKCVSNPCTLTKGDLVFCIRFITTLLFLRVKCSRPMTYQFLTVTMLEKAKTNGGFIDQTEFKTAQKYIFDTLIITGDVMELIELYLRHIRPRLNPQCDFLLLSTNGTQFQSLTTAMVMLVHQAIGKHINPTRYRQIVETESSERLTLQEQQYVSEDQKHSSKVAQIYYKKKHSRKVAIESKKCMDKMTIEGRAEPTRNLMSLFNNLDDEFDENVLLKSQTLIGKEQGCSSSCSSTSTKNYAKLQGMERDPYQPTDEDDITDLEITKITPPKIKEQIPIYRCIPNDDIVVKKEVVSLVTKKTLKNVKFTNEEDKYLETGIRKYGRKAWAQILKDNSFQFHSSRTRDSLRMRADSSTFRKLFSL